MDLAPTKPPQTFMRRFRKQQLLSRPILEDNAKILQAPDIVSPVSLVSCSFANDRWRTRRNVGDDFAQQNASTREVDAGSVVQSDCSDRVFFDDTLLWPRPPVSPSASGTGDLDMPKRKGEDQIPFVDRLLCVD